MYSNKFLIVSITIECTNLFRYIKQYLLYVLSWGPPRGGGQGGNGPPKFWGASNAFGPPNFWKNFVMYTINMQCFLFVFFVEQKTVECMHSVHCIVHTMLFTTGYCSIHVYSQTYLHDLLVAHYTGNRQSTV